MKKLWNKIKAHFSGWPESKEEVLIPEPEPKKKKEAKKPKGLKPKKKKKKQSK